MALAYLERIGVCPTQIKRVVATHWHRDHILGIAETLRAAPEAEFYCPAALQVDELYTLVMAARSPGNREHPASEFARVLEILEERQTGGGSGGWSTTGPAWASQGTVVFDRSLGFPVHVRAVAPSPGATTLAAHQLGKHLPVKMEQKRRPLAADPNVFSIVLHVRAGKLGVLLGGDLENRADPNVGWKAVLSASNYPQGTCSVIKVPHHGSADAHNDDLWTQKLSSAPTAILTPFSPQRLPTSSDQERLVELAGSAYCTHRSRRLKESKDGGATRMMKRRKLRPASGRAGHVRIRGNPETGRVSVARFNGAVQIV